MPSKSAIEKAQKRLEAQQKRESRKAAKEAKAKELAAKRPVEDAAVGSRASGEKKPPNANVASSTTKNGEAILLTLPDDAIHQIFCFLSAPSLGCLIMSCRQLNFSMGNQRVRYTLCRLATRSVKLCSNHSDARALLNESLGGGETGRLVTKKIGNGKNGSADEFIGFARYLEDVVSGFSTLSSGNKANPIKLPAFVNGRMASVSPEHSICRVGGDGVKSGPGGSGVASWGVGRRGQLGHGKREDLDLPKMLTGGLGYSIRIVQVSAGGGLTRVAHSLLLTSTGRVLAFGTGQYGQLGFGYSDGKQLPDHLRPRYIDSLGNIRCICVSAGELHSAVVSSDGDLYTFGDGFCGQLGHGDKRPLVSPKQVEAGGLEDECVSMVSCGNRHTLAVTEEGEVFSFGLGHFGVLGRSFTPFEYDADAAVVAFGGDLDEGFQGAAPPAVDGTTTAIGGSAVAGAQPPPPPPHNSETEGNGRGEFDLAAHLDLIANLSLDDSSDQCIPTVVDSLKGIKIVGACAGHRHSLFQSIDGDLYSCGAGKSGALGHADLLPQMYPLKVNALADNGIKIMQMSAGVDISMAVSTSGEVYSWGKADGGRIGLGMMSEIVKSPQRVPLWTEKGEKTKAVDVECGYVHSLIVLLNGTVRVCGGVGTDGEADGVKGEVSPDELGKPIPIQDFNIWHRIPEPKEAKPKQERWKKYGKYELKGRSKMMAMP